METILNNLTLLRPWWLLLFPVGLLAVLAIRHKRGSGGSWHDVIDPALAPYLLQGSGKSKRINIVIPIIALLLSSIALAGPAWEKRPTPIFRAENALIILLDLSRSMDATDISSSRLARAKLKVTDICRLRKEGQTALIAYAAEPFVVAPLTDDIDTITNQLSALNTAIMPQQGSRPDRAIAEALNLFRQAGLTSGSILMVTDGVSKKLKIDIPSNFALHIIGVGTNDSAPIPKPGGGFLTDKSGAIVVPRFDQGYLQQLSSDHGGTYAPIRLDDADIAHLIDWQPEDQQEQDEGENRGEDEHTSDQWIEQGPWLIIAALPFIAFLLRNQILMLLIISTLTTVFLSPQPAMAFGWDDLWQRSDQQGAKAFQREAYKEATDNFQDPRWQAAAHFRNGYFEKAAETLGNIDGATAEDHYNRGNALAKAGKLQEALAAYYRSLELNEDHEDAAYNRDLIAKAMESDQDQQRQGDPSSSDEQQDGESGDNQEQQSEQSREQQSDQSQEQQSDQSQGQQSDEQNQQSQDSQGDEQSKDQQSDSSQSDQQSDESQQDQQQSEQSTDDGDASDEDAESKKEEAEKAGDPSEGDGEEGKRFKEREQSLNDSLEQRELHQASEQWLRRIPDDPGGLLRRKFEYIYKQRKTSPETEQW